MRFWRFQCPRITRERCEKSVTFAQVRVIREGREATRQPYDSAGQPRSLARRPGYTKLVENGDKWRRRREYITFWE